MPAGQDIYSSNEALYADSTLVEGIDYGRRYRTMALIDDDYVNKTPYYKTSIVAPHGGGIEVGTSELCVAIAGYHPADLSLLAGSQYNYWMFEGLRDSNNGELHVTASNCDDRVALSICEGSLNVFAVHGCKPEQLGLASAAQTVAVGGLNDQFKQILIQEYVAAGFDAVDAGPWGMLNGDLPDNITNRTLLGMGGQVEMTTPLRNSMFSNNTRAGRRGSTTQLFWDFVGATRTAISRLESLQTSECV